MSRRHPSPPPEISGFEYLSVIGSGGYSDVFLYQQRRPRRRVAVKVLLNEWSSPSQRAAFDAEADLMATLSTHPSIVTMYEANVAADGRPYLAMEYCSKPNLGTRYRQERLAVAEALKIGVQIAGAVETAHRAGILHRDIKPANILVTEYGHPVLTDFGISSTIDDAGLTEGMSVPWSPPESFDDPPTSSVTTDVWALGATIYTLLARRSPFEVPGGSNSNSALASRIQTQELVPTGRSDVPASLERVLATSMAKSTASRYQSVLELARGLQQVQNELSFSVTPIDLLEDVAPETGGDVGVRADLPVSSSDPVTETSASRPGPLDGAVSTGSTDRFGVGPPRQVGVVRLGGEGRPRERAPAPRAPLPPASGQVPRQGTGAPVPMPVPTRPVPGVDASPTRRSEQLTWQDPGDAGPRHPGRPVEAVASSPVPVPAPRAPVRPGGTTSSPPPVVETPRGSPTSPRWLWATVAVAGVLVVAVVLLLTLLPIPWPWRAGEDPPPDDVVPDVTGLSGEWNPAFGAIDFQWDPLESMGEDDAFGYRVISPKRQASDTYTKAYSDGVSVVAIDGDTVCIEVVVILRNGTTSASPTGICVEAG